MGDARRFSSARYQVYAVAIDRHELLVVWLTPRITRGQRPSGESCS
jgi:hypothetical protein